MKELFLLLLALALPAICLFCGMYVSSKQELGFVGIILLTVSLLAIVGNLILVIYVGSRKK